MQLYFIVCPIIKIADIKRRKKFDLPCHFSVNLNSEAVFHLACSHAVLFSNRLNISGSLVLCHLSLSSECCERIFPPNLSVAQLIPETCDRCFMLEWIPSPLTDLSVQILSNSFGHRAPCCRFVPDWIN